MSQSRDLRPQKDKSAGWIKRIFNTESSKSDPIQRENPWPDTVVAMPEFPRTSLESQAQSTAAEPMLSKSRWYSKRTPKWNDAVQKWRAEDPNGYLELESMTEEMIKSPIERTDALSRFQPADTSSKQITARLKRWQLTLGAIRGIVMSVAALDPHKIAPMICAAAFFSIDILFDNMHPEERDKVVDILFDCCSTIREYISFEMNFVQKSHPAIESDISAVEDMLPDQYLAALRLVFDIQRSCKKVERENKSKWERRVKDRVHNLWTVFSGEYAVWDKNANEMKRQKNKWTGMKKDLEDKLSNDEHNVKVQKWMKKGSDPEPQLDTIKRRVMPDGKYEDAAQWFLGTTQFKAWCDTIQKPERPPAAKPVLWLRGTYGTGKTTLLYHTYAALKEEMEFHVGSRAVRIVPYFCDANKAGTTRPDYETIIRALIRHLSLLPDFTLATPAQDLYNKATSTKQENDNLAIDEWEDLFEKLVKGAEDDYQSIFIVDALDECLDLREAERFLKFMSKRIMGACPNVYLLCSSRQHVRVRDFFCEQIRYEVEVTPAATAHDMETFITGELARRKEDAGDSVFYKPQHADLLENLQNTLLGHARGMFRWVQIWLDIFLPALDDLNTIRESDHATELLEQLRSDVTIDTEQQLTSGYRRLWGFNKLRNYENQRVRLFQIVLGAFKPQSPENLAEALRIQDGKYKRDLTTEVVKRLYSNFLYEDQGALRFIHDSARKFILNMDVEQVSGSGDNHEAQFSERNNHMAIANLYIDVVGDWTHQFWQVNELEPSKCWTEFTATSPKADRLQQDEKRWNTQLNSFHVYLVRHGLLHCALAAKKRSMFDRVWSKVLDRVILNPVSAFAFTTLIDRNINCPTGLRGLVNSYALRKCLGEWEERIKLFPSHLLALLNIIHEDDVSHLRFTTEKPCGTIEEDRLRLLFEHAACVGGGFTSPTKRFSSYEKATALHLACDNNNRAAVDMILQATKCFSKDSANSILFTRTEIGYYPISLAINNHFSDNKPSYIDIVEALIKFEKDNSSMSGVGSRPHSTTVPYESKQWSLKSQGEGPLWPMLHMAAAYFDEDQMCHLLSVARPEDINMRDEWGHTVLHIIAREGLVKLARKLVEEYGAIIEAESDNGWTPPFLAVINKRRELVEYFKSRGADVDFEAR